MIMIKKTMTYKDYNGNERTEDFYFHLTKAELLELEMSHAGGFSVAIERLIKEQDAAKIISIFKDIIKLAYGVKSDDGKRFIKNEKVFEEFKETEAYSDLFMSLAMDADAATDFVNGLMPSDI